MNGKLKYVAVEKIASDSDSMRLGIGGESFRELVASIRRDGVITPVLLREKNGGYEVIAGHRRMEAVRELRLGEVPAYITDCDDAGRAGLCFAENLFRQDLSAIEQAAAIVDCLKSGEFTEGSLASALGRSEQWIRHNIIIASWPDDLQQVVHEGRLSVSAAQNLAVITDNMHRKMLVDYACENGATARTTAAWLQAWQAGRLSDFPGDVDVEPAKKGAPPIEPYTLCAVCKNPLKMIELSYLPVCARCSEIVMEIARSLADKEG